MRSLALSLLQLLFLTLKQAYTSDTSWVPTVLADYYLSDIHASRTEEVNAQANQWKINGVSRPDESMMNCVYDVLGGPSYIKGGDQIERVYTSLPKHSIVFYTFRMLLIDDWDPKDIITIGFDGQSVLTFYPDDLQTGLMEDYCGSSNQLDKLISVKGIIFHTGSTLSIKITSSQNDFVSYALFEMKITFRDSRGKHVEGSYILKPSDSSTGPGISICSSSKFFDERTQTCLPCHSTCQECFGPTETECFGCTTGHTFDDDYQSCISCSSNCHFCSGPNENNCEMCSSTTSLQWDHVCKISCTPPYILAKFDSYCQTPCEPTGRYMLWDNSCSELCTLPLQVRISGRAKFCDSPCNRDTSEYLYWNGSCKAHCPFHPRVRNGYRLCEACRGDHFLYPNMTCLPRCPSPYRHVLEGGSNLCMYPCDDGMFYYESGVQCRSTCPYPYQIRDSVFCVLVIARETKAKIQVISDSINGAKGTATAVGSTVSLINFSNPLLIFIQIFADMSKYLKYLDIGFPSKLQVYLNTELEPLFTIIPIPDAFETDIPKYSLPAKFDEDENLHSSFLVNFWDSLVLLFTVCSVLALVFLLTRCFRSNKSIQSLGTFLLKLFRWNFAVTIFISYFADIILFTSFELRTTNPTSFLEAWSFMVCFFINILVLVVLGKILTITLIRYNLKKRQAQTAPESLNNNPSYNIEHLNRYQVVFQDYKDGSFLQSAFLLIFTSRIYLFIAIVAYFPSHPLCQTLLLTFLNLAMFFYLLIVRPLKAIGDQIQYFVQELIFLVLNSAVLAFAILDYNNLEETETREKLGEVIIACNITFSVIATICIATQVFLMLRSIYNFIKMLWKSRRSSAVRPLPNDSRLDASNFSANGQIDLPPNLTTSIKTLSKASETFVAELPPTVPVEVSEWQDKDPAEMTDCSFDNETQGQSADVFKTKTARTSWFKPINLLPLRATKSLDIRADGANRSREQAEKLNKIKRLNQELFGANE